MQITQWHKGTDKPVRDGVYEREFCDGIYYSMFKNGFWMWREHTYERALISNVSSMSQNIPWRGVTKP